MLTWVTKQIIRYFIRIIEIAGVVVCIFPSVFGMQLDNLSIAAFPLRANPPSFRPEADENWTPSNIEFLLPVTPNVGTPDTSVKTFIFPDTRRSPSDSQHLLYERRSWSEGATILVNDKAVFQSNTGQNDVEMYIYWLHIGSNTEIQFRNLTLKYGMIQASSKSKVAFFNCNIKEPEEGELSLEGISEVHMECLVGSNLYLRDAS